MILFFHLSDKVLHVKIIPNYAKIHGPKKNGVI